jgi:hypothetical protein
LSRGHGAEAMDDVRVIIEAAARVHGTFNIAALLVEVQ